MRDKITLAALVCLMFVFTDCASTHEPYLWSKTVGDMPTNVYGSWVWLTLEKSDSTKKGESFGGELIAVSPDSLYVAAPTVRVLARTTIANVRLTEFDSRADGVAMLSVLGNLSTISNGVFGLITGPMWLVGGTISASLRSFTPVFDYTGASCDDMLPFARFPAGMPEQVDRSTITMVPIKNYDW
jgi:hypothetical protein